MPSNQRQLPAKLRPFWSSPEPSIRWARIHSQKLRIRLNSELKFQDTDITEHIAKITKEEAKDIVNRKRPEANVKDRVDQNREKSQQNRFKIVNYTRALNETSEEFTDANQKLTIVDVEKDRTNISLETSQAATSSAQASSYSDIADEPYVYDIYLADASENAIQYPDSVDLNDLRLVLMDEVYCSYYAFM